MQKRKTVHTIGHGYNLCVAVTPDGRRIISASFDCTIRVWDLKTGEALAVAKPGENLPFFSVAVAPDGITILAGDQFRDGTGDVNCLRYVDPNKCKSTTEQGS